MLGFLSARAITGLETVVAGVYRRSISVAGRHGWVSVEPGVGDWLEVTVDFPEPAAMPEIERRLRRMFDLDAVPEVINAQLSQAPLMAQLVAARPGLRLPGTWDGLELAMRAVLGQQITVVAAIRLAGKLVAQYGQAVQTPHAGITHLFPTPEVLAAADLATLGMPKARGRTLSGVAQALLDDPQLFQPKASLKDGVARLVAQYGQALQTPHAGITHLFPTPEVLAAADLATLGMPKARGRTLSGVAQALLDDPQLFQPKASLKDGVARLVALPGIGEWTAQYIAMRQLREADAFAPGDIGLINALAALEGGPVSARQLLARAEAWRPLRAYAAQHLWTSLNRGD